MMKALVRVILVIALCTGASNCNNAQTTGNSVETTLHLRGTQVSAHLEVFDPKADSFKIAITIRFELINSGDQTVLVVCKNLPYLTRSVITLGSGRIENETILYDETGINSVLDQQIWNRLPTRLNSQVPPRDLVRVIPPGQSWVWEHSDTIQGRVAHHTPKPFEAFTANWENLTSFSPVYYRGQFEFWLPTFESPQGSGHLGKDLQKRWRSVGELQIGSLWSEPIRLDLPDKNSVQEN